MQYKVDVLMEEDIPGTHVYCVMVKKKWYLPYRFVKNENGIMVFHNRSEAESMILMLKNNQVPNHNDNMITILLFIISIICIIYLIMILWNV